MAVEGIEGGGFVITGHHIDIFRMKSIESALALEVNHPGMTRSARGSTMKVAKQICGSGRSTKRGVLLDFVVWCKREVPQWRPMSGTKKALADVRMSKKLRTELGL